MKMTVRHFAVAIAVLAVIGWNTAQACGFHMQINGGFQVSYPGALGVAVAVARAREDGILDRPRSVKASLVEFQRAIRNLRELQLQLETRQVPNGHHADLKFALVLVGPSLWSEFDVTASGVMARYHMDGPGANKIVVLTHPAVLEALLRNHITVADAVDRGLISFAAPQVRRVFEDAFVLASAR